MNSESLRNLRDMIRHHEPGSGPRDIWAPGYGWILRNGEGTENTEQYLLDHPDLLADVQKGTIDG
jgi:hypothetical protein